MVRARRPCVSARRRKEGMKEKEESQTMQGVHDMKFKDEETWFHSFILFHLLWFVSFLLFFVYGLEEEEVVVRSFCVIVVLLFNLFFTFIRIH
jgi:hypothetical protein